MHACESSPLFLLLRSRLGFSEKLSFADLAVLLQHTSSGVLFIDLPKESKFLVCKISDGGVIRVGCVWNMKISSKNREETMELNNKMNRAIKQAYAYSKLGTSRSTIEDIAFTPSLCDMINETESKLNRQMLLIQNQMSKII